MGEQGQQVGSGGGPTGVSEQSKERAGLVSDATLGRQMRTEPTLKGATSNQRVIFAWFWGMTACAMVHMSVSCM